jgi:hypothetical protein
MKRLIVVLAFAVGVWPGESQAASIFSDNASNAFSLPNSGADSRHALLDDVEVNKGTDLSMMPEPGSLVLFGAGLVYLGRRLRRPPVSSN